jgi:PAS domain-containing protein
VGEGADLSNADIQAQLIADALLSANVGFLVWDDDRRYIAVNDCACRILGTTREELLGRIVGRQTEDGETVVAEAVRKQHVTGRLTVEKLDGSGPVELEYTTFATKTAGMPFMASIIWEAQSL